MRSLLARLKKHRTHPSPTVTGYVSQLADEMEEAQLHTGEELLRHTAELLRWPAEATAGELRFCVHRLREALREALRDALRVAESRGGHGRVT
ncbi:hypothetical protein [Streptomyces lydicus]|uniref:hypothetical protein n=1 Tax=Streptomyces lydicus TaxID=47763 RepID=UPI001F505BF5|nr:hypothetical protein [Streptomyces lydicus]MCZ1008619.1 hypothetical protein [Streptomyces lydicus]